MNDVFPPYWSMKFWEVATHQSYLPNLDINYLIYYSCYEWKKPGTLWNIDDQLMYATCPGILLASDPVCCSEWKQEPARRTCIWAESIDVKIKKLWKTLPPTLVGSCMMSCDDSCYLILNLSMEGKIYLRDRSNHQKMCREISWNFKWEKWKVDMAD